MLNEEMSQTFHTHPHKPPTTGLEQTDAPRRKIKLPPYIGMQPPPHLRHKIHPPWLTVGLTVFGFLAIVALFADMFSFSRAVNGVAPVPKAPADLMLAITTTTNRYFDPLHRFSIALPPGWTASFGDSNVEYDAILEGPDRLALQVVIGDAPGETITNLVKSFSDMEQEVNRDTHITVTNFRGLPAISRFTRMDVNALRTLDFLAGTNTEFHLMGIIPREEFDTRRPIIDALIETLQPGNVP